MYAKHSRSWVSGSSSLGFWPYEKQKLGGNPGDEGERERVVLSLVFGDYNFRPKSELLFTVGDWNRACKEWVHVFGKRVY